MTVTRTSNRAVSHVVMAVLTVLLGLVGVVASAGQAIADSCSSCGESDTDLHFYANDGAVEVPSGGTFPYGQPLKLYAIVLDVSGSCDIGDCNNPSGHVYFYDNGAADPFAAAGPDPNNYTPMSSTSNNVSSWYYTVSNLAVGAHSIKALYHSGAFSVSNPHKFDDSEDTRSVTITKAATTVTLSNGTPNPSSYGQSVSFAVTVTPNPAVDPSAAKPTGKVQLTLPGDATVYAEATIDANGAATLTTSSLPVGTYTQLAAAYVGDANYDAHLSNDVTQTVSKAGTSTTLTASPNPATFGQSTLLTATVSPNTATGTITFKDGATVLGTGTVSGGTATLSTSALTAGTHALTAVYGGENNFTGSTGSLSLFVQKAATATTLSSSPQPTVFGQSTTLTATVSPASATGTVTFYDGGNSIGTGTLALVSGTPTATLSTSALAVGAHTLTASYGGDSNHESSGSSTYTHTVQKADTATTLTGPANPIDFGSTAPLSIHVAAVAPGAGTPTGTVTLTEGPILLGNATLSGGNASFNAPDLLPGTHVLTATYGGDGNFNGSTSNTATVTVTCQANQSAPVSGNMTIGSGSTCVTAPTVTGSIYIGSGARVYLGDAKVYGSIFSTGASTIALCGVTGNGRLSITGTTGPVVVGNTNTRSCGPTKFYGAVTIEGNRGGLTILGNSFPSLDLNNNTAPPSRSNLVGGNTISGRLQCSGNSPPPTNGGNVNRAAAKYGQCTGI